MSPPACTSLEPGLYCTADRASKTTQRKSESTAQKQHLISVDRRPGTVQQTLNSFLRDRLSSQLEMGTGLCSPQIQCWSDLTPKHHPFLDEL